MSTPGNDEEESTMVGGLEVVQPASWRRAPPMLRQIDGPGAPREFALELDSIIVGRSQQAHISIESTRISRRHMSLERSGPEYVCSDLDSANGVYLNGVKAHSAVLREGDTLQIGDVVLVYHEGR